MSLHVGIMRSIYLILTCFAFIFCGNLLAINFNYRFFPLSFRRCFFCCLSWSILFFPHSLSLPYLFQYSQMSNIFFVSIHARSYMMLMKIFQNHRSQYDMRLMEIDTKCAHVVCFFWLEFFPSHSLTCQLHIPLTQYILN